MSAVARRFPVRLCIEWVFANVAGGAAGLALFWWALRAGETHPPQPLGLRLLLALVTETGLLLVVPAAVTGSLQWLVLRSWLERAGWWVAASTAALAAGMWALLVVFTLWVAAFGDESQASIVVSALAGGLTAGGVQWFALRRQTRHAGWWVIVSGLAGPVCMAVFLAATTRGDISVTRIAAAGALIGTLYGAMTGPVLAWLLRARAAGAPQSAGTKNQAAADAVAPYLQAEQDRTKAYELK